MAGNAPLKGKVVLITGASSGIGRALALKCAESGAHVALAARRKSLLDTLSAEIRKQGGVAYSIKTDMSKENEVRRMVRQTHKEFGRIDVLVNNASSGLLAKLENCPQDEMQQLFNTNFFGIHTACTSVIPIMKKHGDGHIINIASLASHASFPFYGAYASTKAALKSYTDGLRLEMKPHSIHVSTIYPGAVNTDFLYSSRNLEGKQLRLKREKKKTSIVKRIGKKAVGRYFFQEPEGVADDIIRCIVKPKREAYSSPLTRMRTLISQLMPKHWDQKMKLADIEKGLFQDKSKDI